MRLTRRLCQVAVFAVFSFLFLETAYTDRDVLPYAVNVFLRLDPLVAGAATVAGRAVIALVWPSLLVVAATLFLGRAFCGWFCPLGSILDFVRGVCLRGVRPRQGVPVGWRRGKYYVLLALAGSSVLTLQLVFLLDPLSLLIRSLTVAVYPALNLTANALFGGLYFTGFAPVTSVSEPIYGFLRTHVLAFEQPYFVSAGLVGGLFLALVALEAVQPRFWCRNLCPLGALLGLLGRWSPVRRRVSDGACTRCGRCRRACPTGAIGDDPLPTAATECTQCLECRQACPEGAIRFLAGPASGAESVGLSRRGAVTALVLGAAAVPVFRSSGYAKAPDPRRIRPPGALPEAEFLARCTRCGECMRVCIANGLQPSLFQAGLPGLWSPILVPRIGYCEYNCTLCGQVCPTGAIHRLTLDEKHRAVVGLAEVDRSRCLPWKGDADCIVCEEHCPTPEKAIVLREAPVAAASGEARVLKLPFVDESRCVGCGICETKCPLADRSAITVSSRGESRAAGAASGYPGAG